MKSVNIYTSLNGVGLQMDTDILKSLLIANGYEVSIIDYIKRQTGIKSDIGLHLEIPRYDDLHANKVNILIPNPEWFDVRWKSKLNQFDRVFTKTFHATDIFKRLHPATDYCGFTSYDYYDKSISKEKILFHLEGKSMFKNTEVLVGAYKNDSTLPCCYSVSSRTIGKYNQLQFTERQSIENLKVLMNACLIHVCPSQYEGFGHYINEARSCGAVVITSDYAPMNEFVKDNRLLVSGARGRIHNLTPMFIASENSLSETIKRVQSMELSELIEIGLKNRAMYLKNDKEFKQRFIDLLNG